MLKQFETKNFEHLTGESGGFSITSLADTHLAALA